MQFYVCLSWRSIPTSLPFFPQSLAVTRCDFLLTFPTPFPPLSSALCAARALLTAAHRNLRITKFVLLSESDLPLYSPALLYTQVCPHLAYTCCTCMHVSLTRFSPCA
jgi:hypothetical protein